MHGCLIQFDPSFLRDQRWRSRLVDQSIGQASDVPSQTIGFTTLILICQFACKLVVHHINVLVISLLIARKLSHLIMQYKCGSYPLERWIRRNLRIDLTDLLDQVDRSGQQLHSLFSTRIFQCSHVLVSKNGPALCILKSQCAWDATNRTSSFDVVMAPINYQSLFAINMRNKILIG